MEETFTIDSTTSFKQITGGYFFIPTRTELNSLSIYILFVVGGLWLHVMQVDVFRGQSHI